MSNDRDTFLTPEWMETQGWTRKGDEMRITEKPRDVPGCQKPWLTIVWAISVPDNRGYVFLKDPDPEEGDMVMLPGYYRTRGELADLMKAIHFDVPEDVLEAAPVEGD
ncbi:hypothetical protein [Fimbriiglobus ruber]|uniref:Uncharacterized protein n=1 Tax=Fimbriiglobus ruber TaxID=1908690 RepID=A0A225DB06_9BACT|nr:hypothetical protein [Fimbriiglobus ruber]OWK34319.1 hypothetical protein FRUB_10290 [Fimbriiglobus ruber]